MLPEVASGMTETRHIVTPFYYEAGAFLSKFLESTENNNINNRNNQDVTVSQCVLPMDTTTRISLAGDLQNVF